MHEVIFQNLARSCCILIISTLLLASCGGGSDDGGDPLSEYRPAPPVHEKHIQWVNPVPQNIYYFGMTTADTSTFAVGEWGTIIKTSDGGVNWADIYTGTSQALFDIEWNGTTYVAVGSGGTILSSGDGIQWTIQDSGTTFVLRKVHWTGNQFIAVGGFQTMLSSDDGINWHKYSEGAAKNGSFYLSYNDLTTGNGRHVMVASDGYIFHSSDGINWSKSSTGFEGSRINGYAADFYGVTWTGSDFVAVGEQGIIVTSPDGIKWQRRFTANNRRLLAVGVANGVVVIAGDYGTVLTGHDLENWTIANSGTEHIYTLSVTNEISVVFNKIIALSNRGTVNTTFDRVNWSQQTSLTGTPFLNDAVWNGSRFVAVGGSVLTSQDGIAWQHINTTHCCSLLSVIWADTAFMAVGGNGVITSSSDGLSWQTQTSGTQESLQDIVWNGSQYLVVGDNGTVLTSSNGTVWTVQSSGFTGDIRKVTWNGSRYVAAGVVTTTDAASYLYFDSYVLTSTDGVNWQNQAFDGERFWDLIWTGSQYHIAGDAGLLLSSTDGDNWSSTVTGISTDIRTIDWVDGQYILSHYPSLTPSYTIYSGTTLSSLRSIEVPRSIYGAVSDSQQTYLIGRDGNIFNLINTN